MRNYVQLGDNITLPAPYNVASGNPALIGAIVGVASTDALQGEDCSFVRIGVFNPLPKVAGQTWAPGTKLYFDAATKSFTSTATGAAIGAAAAGAASADVTGAVMLTGQLA